MAHALKPSPRTLASEDYEVVGCGPITLPTVECQLVPPLVRRKGHNQYHYLISGDEGEYHFKPHVFDSKNVQKDLNQERVVLLPEPQSAFSGVTVLFVSDDFRQQAGAEDKIRGSQWFQVSAPTRVGEESQPRDRLFHGTVVQYDDALAQTNLWADRLRVQAETIIRKRLLADMADGMPGPADEAPILKMALDAVHTPDLKRQLFLAKGLSLTLSGDQAGLAEVFKAATTRRVDFGTMGEFSKQIETYRRNLVLSEPDAEPRLVSLDL